MIRKIILVLMNKSKFNFLSDKFFLKFKYRILFSKKLDLAEPKTFNEKMQWLKLYDRKDIYTIMVDKYEVKKYVADIIGEKYIIPTISVYDRFEDINFNELPDKFVIKCTHDSGGLFIVDEKSKMDLNAAKKRINKCLKRNFYNVNREWPYKNVKPRIIIEKYMKNDDNSIINDYKFFCFDGLVKFFKIDFDRFIQHRANYYSTSGILLPFGEVVCPPDYNKELKMPKNLKKMIELASELSKGISFLRVDFYEVNDEVYFGELTFYPNAGFGKFIPNEYDKKIGDLLNLNNK